MRLGCAVYPVTAVFFRNPDVTNDWATPKDHQDVYFSNLSVEILKISTTWWYLVPIQPDVR